MNGLEKFKNFIIARIFLPLWEEDIQELDCVVHAPNPPQLEVTFLPGQLPKAGLDLRRNCKLFYQADGQNHILNTSILSVLSSEKLLLEAKKAKIFQHVREYFRVDAVARVRYERVAVEGGVFQEYEGLINISGGGIRFPVEEPFSLKQKLFLEISSGQPVLLHAAGVGEVVRAQNFGRKKFVALKFIEMERKDQENIISFCMAVQRDELRTRVRVSGLG